MKQVGLWISKNKSRNVIALGGNPNPPPRYFIMLIEALLSLSLLINRQPATIEIQQEFQNNVEIELILDELSECESNQNPLAINEYDQKDNTHSYGLFQFGEQTFFEMNERYKILPDLERNEVLNVIYDPDTQRKLAREMIKDKLYFHWLVCMDKINILSRLK